MRTSVDFSYWGYPILLNESVNELVIMFRGKDYKAVFVWKGVFLYHGMGLDSTVFSFCDSWAGELILDSTRVLCSFEVEWLRLPSRGP